MEREVSQERIDLYRRLLDLGPGADIDEVSRSYRRAMSNFHPDVSGGDEGTARLLNEARDYFVAHPSKIRSASRVDATPVGSGASTPPTPPRRSTVRVETRAEPAPRVPQPPPRTPRAETVAAPVVAQPPAGARISGGWISSAFGYVMVAGYGAAKILYYLVILYFVFVAITLVVWFFTTVLPWMQRILQ